MGLAHHLAVGRTHAQRIVSHGQDALTRTRRALYPAKSFELGVSSGSEVVSAVCRCATNPRIGVTAKRRSFPQGAMLVVNSPHATQAS